ncbi:putative rRNA-processing protein EBP2, partial [Tyrophagus putrescentiae]
MGKKFLFESILNKQNESDGEDLESEEEGGGFADSDLDSDDAELQRAFAAGELKPGLHGLVAFKRTENLVNDEEGMKRKLAEIAIYKNNWLERLDLTNEPAKVTPDLQRQYGDIELKRNRDGEVVGEADPAQHDFKREMLFYRQAQATVIEGIKRLHTAYGIKQTARPADYFAEMVKSDEQMQKVRERLQAKQNSIEASEKAKKQRDLKKYGKKVQQEVQLKRQAEKREMLTKIQNYKKGKEGNLDFLDDEATASGKKKPAGKGQQQQANKPAHKKNKKQQYKEARYGYGGQKKRSKYNTADSAANISGFSAKKHGRPKIGGAGGKKKKTGGANRPGKSKRQNMKQRRG